MVHSGTAPLNDPYIIADQAADVLDAMEDLRAQSSKRRLLTAALLAQGPAIQVEVYTHLRDMMREGKHRPNVALGVAAARTELALRAAWDDLITHRNIRAELHAAVATTWQATLARVENVASPTARYLAARAAGVPAHLAPEAVELLAGRCVWTAALIRARSPRRRHPRTASAHEASIAAELTRRIRNADVTPHVVAVPRAAAPLAFFPHAWPLVGAVASLQTGGTNHRFGVLPAAVATALADIAQVLEPAHAATIKVLGPLNDSRTGKPASQALWEVAAELWSPPIIGAARPDGPTPLEQVVALLA